MQADAIDPHWVLAALGVVGQAQITPVSGGQDTLLWRVERGGDASALRVFRPEQANVCRHEAAVMAIAGDVPVPKVHAMGFWQDRPALLLSWCSGRTLAEECLAHPRRSVRLFRQFGRMLARIHTVAAPEVLLDPRLDWIAQAGERETALQDRLRALTGGRQVLLHLDYHPLNVMTDGVRITAVLDWANTLAGDPRADLARALVVLRASAMDIPPAYRPLLPWMRRVEWGLRLGYREAAGAVQEMAPFMAWAWAMTAHDYEAKRERLGRAFCQHRLHRMQRQCTPWKRRAGI